MSSSEKMLKQKVLENKDRKRKQIETQNTITKTKHSLNGLKKVK